MNNLMVTSNGAFCHPSELVPKMSHVKVGDRIIMCARHTGEMFNADVVEVGSGIYHLRIDCEKTAEQYGAFKPVIWDDPNEIPIGWLFNDRLHEFTGIQLDNPREAA